MKETRRKTLIGREPWRFAGWRGVIRVESLSKVSWDGGKGDTLGGRKSISPQGVCRGKAAMGIYKVQNSM
jgi:hypothetical protein